MSLHFQATEHLNETHHLRENQAKGKGGFKGGSSSGLTPVVRKQVFWLQESSSSVVLFLVDCHHESQ